LEDSDYGEEDIFDNIEKKGGLAEGKVMVTE